MHKKNKLEFSDFDSHSDLEKKIEGEIEEVNVEDEVCSKTADLYKSTLYTAVPASHDHTLGIFPDDQQLSHSIVLLWTSHKTIPPSVIDNGYKVLTIDIPKDVVKNHLTSLGGGVYGLNYVPNTFSISETDNISYNND